MQTFEDFGIDVSGRPGPETKTLCPQCSHRRIKKTDPCLSVNLDKGVWNCHNCGWKGSLSGGEKTYKRPEYDDQMLDRDGLTRWFAQRGIQEPTLQRYRITSSRSWFGEDVGELPSIRFPYFRRGKCVNIKHRSVDGKRFRQEAGAEKIFYGLDDIEGAECVYIVEGEIDKLSLAEAGITSVISVPDGAPSLSEDGDFASARPQDLKFEFIANCWKELDKIKRFVIAVDNDGPGQFLAYHLTRRLGAERCWSVKWPEGCKDANDVLMMCGVRELYDCVHDLEPVPLPGMVSERDLSEQAVTILKHGLGSGISTGYESLDEFYKLATGMFNVVTGIPGHGKSELIDNLIVNTAKNADWIWSIYSPENHPVGFHWLKIIEKWTGFSVFHGGIKRDFLPEAEIKSASEIISKNVILNDCDGEEGVTFDDLLELFRMQILRFGVKGCVIDPWNALDHEAGMKSKSETQYINIICNKARRFAKAHDVALFIVVHPSKMRRDSDGNFAVPSPYDMAGSAHWRNRSDFILCVFRPIENEGEARDFALEHNVTQVLVQKAKHRHLGKLGQATLFWDPRTTRFSSNAYTDVHQETPNRPAPRLIDENEPRFPGFGG